MAARTVVEGSVRRLPPAMAVERALTFLVPLAIYMVVAVELGLVYHSVLGDASSREANAYYVFFSNDPHLAAIGFVWNPLTSLAEMPLILLKGIFPALTADAFAADIMSAVFMAGACYQIALFMQEIGLRRVARYALLACFALNPFILYSGGNGMSEALFIFTLVACTRRLALWIHDGRPRDLIAAGVWIGLAYFARNEAAMAAFLASLVVLWLAYRRANGSVKQRRLRALTDAVLFTAPFGLSFLGWAAASWVIVGHPFEQFSSVYGTSSQLKYLIQDNHYHYSLVGALGIVLAFAPLIPLAAAGAVTRAIRERETRLLAVISVVGGVLLFEVVAFMAKSINYAERYFIYAVPLAVLLAAVMARPVRKSAEEIWEERVAAGGHYQPRFLVARRRQRLALSLVAELVAVAMFVPSFATTYHEMMHTIVGASDGDQLVWILAPGSPDAKKDAPFQHQQAAIVAETRALDALHAGKGGIMADDADECMPKIILASKDPAEFTIPNDQNYTYFFGDPYKQGIRYLLVSDPRFSSLDSLDRQWPGVYADGLGGHLGTLVSTVPLPACPTFRLYRVNPNYNSG